MRRLPGIAFDTVPPPPAEVLPRMDIAVFVGFAATGPLHIPVAVESVPEYENVFGPDAPLGWDAVAGQRVRAHLGPTVRAFFSNRGRRCWVIRVAQSRLLNDVAVSRASPPDDSIPAAACNAFPLAGMLHASADGTDVEAALAYARCEGSWSDDLRVQTALLERMVPTDWFHAEARGFGLDSRHQLQAGDVVRLTSATGVVMFAPVASTSSAQADARSVVGLGAAVAFASVPASPPLAFHGLVTLRGGARRAASVQFNDDGTEASVSVPIGPELTPEAGMWVQIAYAAQARVFWLRCDVVQVAYAASVSPPAPATIHGAVWEVVRNPVQASPLIPLASASVLAFDLRARHGLDPGVTRTDMGLAPGHAREWMKELPDAAFFSTSGSGSSNPSTGGAPAKVLRFPLAGTAGAASTNGGDAKPGGWLIPLGMAADFGLALAAVPQDASAIERDGLSRFDPRLFFDPGMETWNAKTGLTGTTSAVIAEKADFIRYGSPSPRRLFGIHAAMGFHDSGLSEEATLIAVPDAVHLGWEPPRALARASATTAQRIPTPVSAKFVACNAAQISTPRFVGEPNREKRSGYTLTWTASSGSDRYVLEEARSADFADARTIYEGDQLQFEIADHGAGTYYYRVKAVAVALESAWSDATLSQVRDTLWTMRPEGGFAGDGRAQALLDVHAALLRVCAAKAEILAVLSLPRHYRERDAIAHAAALRAAFTESAPPTYGALYHPWPVDRGVEGRYTGYPPDGAVTGVLASRAFDRGAWIAPANEAMKDMVALAPGIGAESWAALLEAQVNVLRQDPRGFLLMSEDTLTQDAELRPICVRRLLILLRRLALRLGANYVFEPHDDMFRRLVQRAFHESLSYMFQRGAFAGATPARSFQVVTDDAINTPQSTDAGRFFADIKVAPSMPLSFLTVRLRQVGERLTVSEVH